MKIAYQEKNVTKAHGSKWGYCDDCIFNMEEKIIEGEIPAIWPCDLFYPNCTGDDIYQQLTKLDEIFRNENLVK